MRRFQHRERNQIPEQFQPPPYSGGRAGEQEDGPRGKNTHGEDRRSEGGEHPAQGSGNLAEPLTVTDSLCADEDHRRSEQRDQVEQRAEGHERASELRCRH